MILSSKGSIEIKVVDIFQKVLKQITGNNDLFKQYPLKITFLGNYIDQNNYKIQSNVLDILVEETNVDRGTAVDLLNQQLGIFDIEIKCIQTDDTIDVRLNRQLTQDQILMLNGQYSKQCIIS